MADGVEIVPLAVTQFREKGAEAGYARMLGITRRGADWTIEAAKAHPGVPGFVAKLPNKQSRVAHRLGREGRVTAIRAEDRPCAPPLRVVAAPISVIDHVRLGGLLHVRSFKLPGIPGLKNSTLRSACTEAPRR
jgi:hypothetical protein